ncbi:MAG: M1 family aminopeptidase [Bacteroidota bacterium]
MKTFLTIIIVTALASSFLHAQVARRDTLSPMEQLINNEMENYKSRFLHSRTGVASDIRYDVKYYKLELKITTTPSNYLYGKITMRATSLIDGLDSISLDLRNNMIIDSIKVNGIPSSYTQQSLSFGFRLDRTYNMNETFTTETYYEGMPQSSGFGSFVFSSHNGVPWIWSLSEPYGAKDWWPCKDHPSDKADSADIIVTVDSMFKVGSNGRLISVVNNGDHTVTYSWHESYPIASYLISVTISNFQSFTDWFHYGQTDSMQVLNYVLPENYAAATAPNGLPLIVNAIGIFSELYGLYPFIKEKYGHCDFGWGGAMEHQTMTSTTSYSEYIIVHELAHQWFGDKITCRTWPDIWLNEGFATYNEAVYGEKKYGWSTYVSMMNGKMLSALNAIGPVHVNDTSNVGYLFSGALVYNKGASFLHMLRHILGDSVFFKGMYAYAHDSTLIYNTASTPDFERNMESVSGKDLSYLFQEWIYGENYPIYAYTWSSQPGIVGYIVNLKIVLKTLTTNPVVFKMPIDLLLGAPGYDTLITVWNDSTIKNYSFNLPFSPATVKFDSANWVLKQFFKPFMTDSSRIRFVGVSIGKSRTDSIIVTNTAAVDMHITSVQSSDSAFTVTPTNATIPSNGQLKFYVTFKPLDVIDHSTILAFKHDLSVNDEQIPLSASGTVTSVIAGRNTPKDFRLDQNYPDPFNPSTTIGFEVPITTHVQLKIFNLLGTEVATLVDGIKPPGQYHAVWDAGNFASGIYLYRLTAGSFLQTKKLVLIK